MSTPAAVLFDLDGTLIDSAPDLAGTANDMLAERGLPPVPYDALRPHAGAGARGMLGATFGCIPGQSDYEPLREEFYLRYEARMLQLTTVFDAIGSLLDVLTQTSCRGESSPTSRCVSLNRRRVRSACCRARMC